VLSFFTIQRSAVRVLSVDPGKDKGGPKSGSGWCYQNPEKVLLWGDTKDLKQFLKEWDFLLHPIDHVVVEGYRIRPGQEALNVGIPLATVENVGAVKMFAHWNDLPIKEYMPFDKRKQQQATGAKITSKTPKELTHRLDAYNHGRWFLIEKNLSPTALEAQLFEEQGIEWKR
jgi:hypothetical protein